MSANGKKQQIQSYVRVRPLNQYERDQRSHSVIEATNKEVLVKPNGGPSKTFTYDKVFGPKSKQLDIYTTVVSPFIKEVLAGYNCTVFAYGQTGTGKTYTMAGGSETGPDSAWQTDPESGIIPRTLSQLFDELRVLQVEHTVRVSYLELYNEELFDLLSVSDDSKLRLYEDNLKKGSVIIHGLEEINVHNKNEVYKILRRGSIRRQTASTLMNAQSSRSHTIFSITVHIKDTSVENVDLLRTGKLNLVDLAGSENIGRSGAVEKRAREAGNINQSLLTLGRVITSLVENAPHVPYRESKLTRLLQDSLGGRTKTSIIATVSPAACNLEETLSTLEYARRAKNITNRPEANQRFSKATLIKHYTDEIERLQRDLLAARSGEGFFLSHENYHQMVNELENYGQEMADKINEIKALCDELENKKDLTQQLKIELTETKAVLMDTVDELKKKKENLIESEFLIDTYAKTEEKLGRQAKTLLRVVDTVSQDTSKLHDKIDTVKNNLQQNTQVSSQFQQQYFQQLRSMDINMVNEIHSQNNLIENFMDSMTKLFDTEELSINRLVVEQKDLSSKRETLIHNLNDDIFKCFETARDNSDNLKQNIRETLNTFSLETQKYEDESYLKQIKEMSKSSNKLFDISKQNLVLLQDSVNNLYEKYQNFSQESNSQLENLVKIVHEYEEENNSVVDQFREACKKAFDKFDTFSSRSKNLLSQMSTATNHMTEFKSTSEAIHQINVQLIDESQQNIQTSEKSLESHSQSLIENIKSNRCETNKRIEGMVNQFAANLDMSLEQNSKNYTSSNNRLTNLKQNEDKLDQAVVESFEMCKKLNAGCLQETSEFSEQLTNYHNSTRDYIQSELKQRSNELEKFFREDIQLEYNATGETPKRRELQYPRYLVKTSPKEQILERFRRNRRLVEDTNQVTEPKINETEQVETAINAPAIQVETEQVETKVNIPDIQVEPTEEQPAPTTPTAIDCNRVEATPNTYDDSQKNGTPLNRITSSKFILTEKENNLEAIHAKALSEQSTLRRSRRILGEANEN